jgi:hypothetical protein
VVVELGDVTGVVDVVWVDVLGVAVDSVVVVGVVVVGVVAAVTAGVVWSDVGLLWPPQPAATRISAGTARARISF